MSASLVSVVIPAFNAADWIDQTLASARGQTHRALEIIVVDDGSTDDTAARVAAVAARDPRVRLIRQPNGGVARARNRGIAAAAGAYVAPLDADDLWAPTKIERQVAAFEAAPADTALVYNWFRHIDEAGQVLGVSPHPQVEGYCLLRHLAWNFISNGSTPLVRTDLARAIGYDPGLRDAGNEGCEDYLFQLRLALRYRFVCVPAFLTGYRQRRRSMASEQGRMTRSHLQLYLIMAAEAPAAAQPVIRRRRAELELRLAISRARRGDAMALAIAALRDPATLARRLRERRAPSLVAGPGRAFPEFATDERDGAWATRRPAAWLDQLACDDARLAADLGLI
ncbi:MAG: hypothetical protein A4S16_10995 [Proteobacteria bacterium SG_bin6]|nr:MAG: hypothetical protein A4S16_10995 [Proteobacteria bacterium SG_bin6]